MQTRLDHTCGIYGASVTSRVKSSKYAPQASIASRVTGSRFAGGSGWNYLSASVLAGLVARTDSPARCTSWPPRLLYVRGTQGTQSVEDAPVCLSSSASRRPP